MTLRNYSSTAAATTITASITNSSTSCVVAATTGFPTAPFIGRLDADTSSEELVLVTAVAGTTLTITRGYDGTTAVSHNSGATFRHSVAAIDLREPNTHVNATGAVHGLTGNIVGDSDTQTLTNKTITGGTVNATTLQVGGVSALTTAHNVASGVHGVTGSVVGTTDTQTLTNKTLTTPTITSGTLNTPTVVGSGGTLTLPAGPDTLVGRATTDTLTNKTLTSPAINGGVLDAASTIGGTSGTTIAANAALLAGASLGYKNALINSVGFPVNQRGAASYSATGYTVDQWLLTLGSGATSSIAPIAPAPGTVPGFIVNYLAWARSVAGTTDTTFEQRIESVSTFAGQTVTVSILCNTAAGSVDFVPSLVQNFGTGGSPSAAVTTTGATLTATTTVQTLTSTFTVPSISGKSLGTGGNDYLSAVLTRAYNAVNGATGTLNIYAVQVELGSAHTPFEVLPRAATLAQCQRYIRRVTTPSGNTFLMPAYCAAANIAYVPHTYPVPMRAVPTITVSAAGDWSIYVSGALTATGFSGTPGVNSTDGAMVQFTISGGTAGQGGALRSVNAGAWMQWSAEL